MSLVASSQMSVWQILSPNELEERVTEAVRIVSIVEPQRHFVQVSETACLYVLSISLSTLPTALPPL